MVLPEALRPNNDAELLTGLVDELRWVEMELKKRSLLLNANNNTNNNTNNNSKKQV